MIEEKLSKLDTAAFFSFEQLPITAKETNWITADANEYNSISLSFVTLHCITFYNFLLFTQFVLFLIEWKIDYIAKYRKLYYSKI